MKIYTVGKSDDAILQKLGFELIEMPVISTDEEIHDFVESKLMEIEFDTLIIAIHKAETTISLRLALHIRLTECLWQKRLVSIMFISTERLGTVIRDAGIYGHILATKGCKFEQITSIEIIKKAIELIDPLLPDNFVFSFLRQVSIQPDEKIGRHSLANQWGALALDKVAYTKALLVDDELKRAEKQLYFKYVMALNFNYNLLEKPQKKLIDLSKLEKADKIEAQQKRILLIDDEADKGWGSVLKSIFKLNKPDDFVIIQEKAKDYQSLSAASRQLIEQGNFDLFLIDLRLNGIEEEEINNPREFSGTKLLEEIKRINAGNQAIMFTASNKAWNMKKLLDLGADGYYIKESPEYNFPKAFTKENYKNLKDEIAKCFQLSFLRNIAKIHTICNSALGSSPFENRSKASLEIAFELLKKSADAEKYLNLAYLTYYQILEDYVGQKKNFDFDYNSGDAYVNGQLVIDGTTKEWKLQFVKKGIVPFDYFVIAPAINDKNWSTISQISFVLAFKFGKDNDYLKKWGYLNSIRNTKAGHGGNKGSVSVQDIKELLEIVELFLTNP